MMTAMFNIPSNSCNNTSMKSSLLKQLYYLFLVPMISDEVFTVSLPTGKSNNKKALIQRATKLEILLRRTSYIQYINVLYEC